MRKFLYLVILVFFLFPVSVSAAVQYNNIASIKDTDNPASKTQFGVGHAFKTGDINGDGYDDLTISAPYADSNRGRLYIYLGGPSFDFIPDSIIKPDPLYTAQQYFPFTDSSYGMSDIDKDGKSDLLLGAMLNHNTELGYYGAGYVFFGTETLNSEILTSEADVTFLPGDNAFKNVLGGSSTTMDFNCDDNLDLVISANSLGNVGAVHFYYGNGGQNIDQNSDLTLEVTGSYFFGAQTLLEGADLNNDGCDDLITSESYSNQGEAYIFFGNNTGENTYDIKITSETPGEGFPRSFDTGNIDGDEYPDLCMGAYQNDTNLLNAGRIYCFYGSYLKSLSTPTTISVLEAQNPLQGMILQGSNIGDNFGRIVHLSDINNDGPDDLLVGAYQMNGSKNGYVQFFLSKNNQTFTNIPDGTIPHVIPAKHFGNSIHTMDINNDGWKELFITQGIGDTVTYEAGTVYVYEAEVGNMNIETETSLEYSESENTLTGTITHDLDNVGGVEMSLDQNTWVSCTAVDGTFDSLTEEFICDLSLLSTNYVDPKSVFLRSFDTNYFYMLFASYAEVNVFEISALSATGSSVLAVSLIGLGLVSVLFVKVVKFKKLHRIIKNHPQSNRKCCQID